VSSVQSYIDDDHHANRLENRADRRDRRVDLDRLFTAHSSPSFHRLVLDHAGIDSPDLGTSLDHCEQVHRSGENHDTEADYPATIEDVDHITDATEALQSSIGRERRRQDHVVGLIGAGEPAHAKRLALCMQQSVQLECPTLAGGCGSNDNYVPASCDSRLCPTCMNRRIGHAIEKYEPVVSSMDNPTLLTFTIENMPDVETGKEAVQGAFGRLRRRVIPTSGEQGEKRWIWRRDGGEPADEYWKAKVLGARRHDLARSLQRRFVDQGKGIPFTELVDGGIYGIDVKQQESGRYHVHIHCIADMAYTPQPALSSVWEDITGAPVMDVRRIGQREGLSAESAIAEVIGYVAKPPEFASVDDEIEYLTALKGSKLIQPFGSVYGNVPDVNGLLKCTDCEVAPAYWNYLGYVDGQYDTMILETDGDRPPPG
jgi:hypothetical protein